MIVRKGTVKGFDSGSYTATVQVAGSLAVWLEDVPVARNIGIAEMVVDIIGSKEDLARNEEFDPRREAPVKFAALSPQEQAALIEEDEEFGIMVCRCETVTQAEVVKAIENPLGARSLDAIKRRCRSMMGRCGGGFCSPRIVEILMDRYGRRPEEICKNNRRSPLFFGLIKE